jgi:hypothetical protein
MFQPQFPQSAPHVDDFTCQPIPIIKDALRAGGLCISVFGFDFHKWYTVRETRGIIAADCANKHRRIFIFESHFTLPIMRAYSTRYLRLLALSHST